MRRTVGDRDQARVDREAAGPVAAALGEVLPEPLGARLVAGTLRWESLDIGVALDRLADRHIGPVPAVGEVAEALTESFEEADPQRVHPHAVRLADRGDLAGGLFACAMTAECGPDSGWPPWWRDLLRRLRAHPDPNVAYTSRTTHTAEE